MIHLADGRGMAGDDDELAALLRTRWLIETRLVVVARLCVLTTLAILPSLADNDARNVIVRVSWILNDLHICQNRQIRHACRSSADGARLEAVLCWARAGCAELWDVAILWAAD